MNVNQTAADIHIGSAENTFYCQHAWNVNGIAALEKKLPRAKELPDETISLDGQAISHMDSAGAWLLEKWLMQLKKQGKQVQLTGFAKKHHELLQLVARQTETIRALAPPIKPPNFFHRVGEQVAYKWLEILGFLILLGKLANKLMQAMGHWRRFRLTNIAYVVEEMGYRALPIIALLSFSIGVVLAYQMGIQLKLYGANVFIVRLTGVAILREFAPLITAIIVAGRTSSSFTAQLGLMKVNEEIDALRTMGVSITECLVLPKLIGLLIALPILTFFADIFGLLGSMLMAKIALNVPYSEFANRFSSEVIVDHYLIGLIKAPVFAVVIAVVGCYQGLQVSLSADSVGRQTTRSVVQAIFLIILVDAAFSVMFSWKSI